ncbi:MAG: hypothetical protein V2A55_01680 [Candidatus Jorgensenbacteria bacterium]
MIQKKKQGGQVMILSVVMLGGILLSAASIAGLLMVYQIRASNDAVNSAKAVFAADAGVEAVAWCLGKGPDCPWEQFFSDAPISFDDAGVTFKILWQKTGGGEVIVVSQGLASGGKVVRLLETTFTTE